MISDVPAERRKIVITERLFIDHVYPLLGMEGEVEKRVCGNVYIAHVYNGAYRLWLNSCQFRWK
jgi:hypothetical protein